MPYKTFRQLCWVRLAGLSSIGLVAEYAPVFATLVYAFAAGMFSAWLDDRVKKVRF